MHAIYVSPYYLSIYVCADSSIDQATAYVN